MLVVMYVAMIDICGLVFVWTQHFSQVDTKDNKQQKASIAGFHGKFINI